MSEGIGGASDLGTSWGIGQRHHLSFLRGTNYRRREQFVLPLLTLDHHLLPSIGVLSCSPFAGLRALSIAHVLSGGILAKVLKHTHLTATPSAGGNQSASFYNVGTLMTEIRQLK
jgi:hypothetical protein